MKIFIAGQTGTGKSTVCKLVSRDLNLKYFASSTMLKEFANLDIKSEGYVGRTKEDYLKREKSDIDERYDKYLLNLVKKEENFVIDSWTMPWLYRGDGIRVYLKATKEERVRRLAQRDNINIKNARKILDMKDKESIQIYKSKYGFSIKEDLDVFDLVIDTTNIDQKEVANRIKKYIEGIR